MRIFVPITVRQLIGSFDTLYCSEKVLLISVLVAHPVYWLWNVRSEGKYREKTSYYLFWVKLLLASGAISAFGYFSFFGAKVAMVHTFSPNLLPLPGVEYLSDMDISAPRVMSKHMIAIAIATLLVMMQTKQCGFLPNVLASQVHKIVSRNNSLHPMLLHEPKLTSGKIPVKTMLVPDPSFESHGSEFGQAPDNIDLLSPLSKVEVTARQDTDRTSFQPFANVNSTDSLSGDPFANKPLIIRTASDSDNREKSETPTIKVSSKLRTESLTPQTPRPLLQPAIIPVTQNTHSEKSPTSCHPCFDNLTPWMPSSFRQESQPILTPVKVQKTAPSKAKSASKPPSVATNFGPWFPTSRPELQPVVPVLPQEPSPKPESNQEEKFSASARKPSTVRAAVATRGSEPFFLATTNRKGSDSESPPVVAVATPDIQASDDHTFPLQQSETPAPLLIPELVSEPKSKAESTPVYAFESVHRNSLIPEPVPRRSVPVVKSVSSRHNISERTEPGNRSQQTSFHSKSATATIKRVSHDTTDSCGFDF